MHISDPHFHRLPRNPLRYTSKRFLGALNLVLRRRRSHPKANLHQLVKRLGELHWDHLLITGDLTQLGSEGEFALARRMLAPLLEGAEHRVTVIPGNHDRYTRSSLTQRGYETYFGDLGGAPENSGGKGNPGDGAPAGSGLRTRQLTERWWLAAWDSAMPVGFFSAGGEVRRETLAATEQWIAALPAGARVILANHYPVFFPPPHRYYRNHDLRNHDEVERWILSQPIQLYLHGHVHHNWTMTVKGSHGPITVVNSASSTRVLHADEQYSFHRIVLEGEGFRVEPMSLESPRLGTPSLEGG